MVDYVNRAVVQLAGGLSIDPRPNPTVTNGLYFNGKDQFLRFGDTDELSLGNRVQMRKVRAFSVWVKFDAFTNNAHIFDFGNGAGKDNVFCGIIGRGNPNKQDNTLQNPVCLDQSVNTVPDAPSGEQCGIEVSPQTLMATSSANVNIWNCPDPAMFGKIEKPIQPKAAPPHEAHNADLLYEIWDEQQRKLHIQVKNAFPLRKWVHIAITASNNDAFAPGIQIYRNGKIIHTEESGWLPQTNFTTNNYIGKSNWTDVTSPYQNADALLKARVFDFRGYRTAMPKKKVQDTYKWGKKLLGLN
jgi:hypothetical protein